MHIGRFYNRTCYTIGKSYFILYCSQAYQKYILTEICRVVVFGTVQSRGREERYHLKAVPLVDTMTPRHYVNVVQKLKSTRIWLM